MSAERGPAGSIFSIPVTMRICLNDLGVMNFYSLFHYYLNEAFLMNRNMMKYKTCLVRS